MEDRFYYTVLLLDYVQILLGHSFFSFCFTDFLDLFLMSEDEKKIKFRI